MRSTTLRYTKGKTLRCSLIRSFPLTKLRVIQQFHNSSILKDVMSFDRHHLSSDTIEMGKEKNKNKPIQNPILSIGHRRRKKSKCVLICCLIPFCLPPVCF